MWSSATFLAVAQEEVARCRSAGIRMEVRLGAGPPPPVPISGIPVFRGKFPGAPASTRVVRLPGRGGVYLVFAPGAGAVLISTSDDPHSSHQIIVWPEAGLSRAGLGDFLVDYAVPIVLMRRGAVLFHAASVVVRGVACLLLGPSGQGKSTLVAAFLEAGHSMLGDDMAVVEKSEGEIVAFPARPVLDLQGGQVREYGLERFVCEAESDSFPKTRLELPVGAPGFQASPVRVARVFLLSPTGGESGSGAPAFERLSPPRAVQALLENVLWILREDEMLLRQRDLVAELAVEVGVVRVSFRRPGVPARRLRDALLERLGDAAGTRRRA